METIKTGLENYVEEIVAEYKMSVVRFGRHRSLHEAWAVIYEELDELWEAVRMKSDGDQRERRAIARKESKQIAAMALKLMVDIDAWGKLDADH